MRDPDSQLSPQVSERRLLDIIRTQSDIARLGLDLGAVMALAAERAQMLTGAEGAAIELAEGEDMVYRASSGTAQRQLGLRLRRQGSLSGLCVVAASPLICEDSETDPRVDRQACRSVGLRSMVVVPLRHNDTVVGVLKVLSGDVSRFSQAEAETLLLISDLLASAMYHAARHEISELFHRATHDPLTGLPNRALFFERLHHTLARSRREARKFAVLNLDMDGLKPINDRFGHRAGDAAIQAVANRLSARIHSCDTVARIGGDEFALLLSTFATQHELEALTGALANSISAPFEFEDRRLELGASIGAAVFPDDAAEPDALIERADQAMYQVKRQRAGVRMSAAGA